MKLQLKIFLSVCLFAFTAQKSFSQSELDIFGFYQAQYVKLKGNFDLTTQLPAELGGKNMTLHSLDEDLLGSNIQQLNLFLRKELSDKFISWINLQFTNNYSSGDNIGTFNLDEAWVRYDYSTALSVKAGLLIPRFVYLHEIKNKTPLLPYILRPLVHEAALGNVISPSIYLPEKAIAQVSGYLPVEEFTIDYAAFIGQLEKNYQKTSLDTGIVSSGLDTVNFKAFGGRAGAKYGDLRVGISASLDKQLDNKALDTNRVQHINRTRIGFDIGYTIFNAFIEGEYIAVSLDPKASTKDLSKQYYYMTLGYNFTDDIFAYGTYSNLKNKEVEFFANGMNAILLGGGFKPDASVVVKAQYSLYYVHDGVTNVVVPLGPPAGNFPTTAKVNLDYKFYALAVSVLF